MRKSFKFRLYPTRKQSETLDREVTAAQRLYNAALEQRRFAWQRRGVTLNYNAQAGDLKDLRGSGAPTPTNFSACQDVLRRLDKAFQAFFRRVRSGGKLYLQGIGEIRVKWHRQVTGKIKTVTVRRRSGRWHVCFSVEYEPHPLPALDADVGIDVGLDHFAALSTGDLIPNPRWYRNAQKRLRRAQRKVARRVKGSSGRRKAVRELQRVHEHVANQRADFVHKLSRQIVDGYQLIAVEKLNIGGMAKGMLAKQVRDAAWRSFLEKLTVKAAEAGRRVVEVNPAGTSQHCLCGLEVRKTLAVRVHRCPECGLVAPRDVVSAQLILRLGRSLTSDNVA